MEPLGLPRGSIRALVTIILCGCVCFLMVQGREIAPTIELIVAIVLGYYFGNRSQSDDTLPGQAQPLYLPKGSIRWIIMGSFFITAGILGYKGHFWDKPVIQVMSLVLGLGLGYVGKSILDRCQKNNTFPETFFHLLNNFKALFVLLVTVILAFLVIGNYYDQISLSWQITLATLVAFYFGIR